VDAAAVKATIFSYYKFIATEKVWSLDYTAEMTMRTVDWTPPRTSGTEVAEAGGLRERKKRLMRQQLSDTATQMFMERGFDAVRVTEIAEACGVSEKTVFNYFPTKESLILDRLDSTMASLKTGLTQPGVKPAEAVLRILNDELSAMTSWLARQDDLAQASAAIRRFGTLIQASPSLRAHQSDMMDQFVAVAAEILAARGGMSPDDPEPQIAATALLGLWRIQFQALSKYLDGTRTPAQVHHAVSAEVNRAAHLIDTGLRSFPSVTPAVLRLAVAAPHPDQGANLNMGTRGGVSAGQAGQRGKAPSGRGERLRDRHHQCRQLDEQGSGPTRIGRGEQARDLSEGYFPRRCWPFVRGIATARGGGPPCGMPDMPGLIPWRLRSSLVRLPQPRLPEERGNRWPVSRRSPRTSDPVTRTYRPRLHSHRLRDISVCILPYD
jgi:AcrR family transcriptional regulator